MAKYRKHKMITVDERFSVVDEGEGWIVVNKGAPLIVHPANDRGEESTLLGGVKELLAYDMVNGAKLSIINRLDRETSGIVLIATKKSMARELGRSMERREILKKYKAVVWGWPKWDKLLVEAPILRQGEVIDSRIYVKQMVHAKGKYSKTNLKVVKRINVGGKKMAVLEVAPQTGRMHQIRVHCAHVEHPIVGDKIYGGCESIYLKFIEEGMNDEMLRVLLMERHALHASRMEVKIDNIRFQWEAGIAHDMAELLALAED